MRALVLSGLIGGLAAAAAPAAEFSFSSLRAGAAIVEPENWPAVKAALNQTPRPFDGVWFSTGVSYPPLAWHEEQSRKCAAAASELRALGLSPSVEIQTVIGHTDAILGSGDCRGQDWTTWIGWDGTVARHASCPRAPGLRTYFARVGAIYAAWKPECVWLDDDFRIANRAPSQTTVGRQVGCWCETCLAAFSQAEGRDWTRETLLAAIQAGDKELLTRWCASQEEALAELARAIAEAIVRVSPETRLGLEGDLAPVLKALHEVSKRPVRHRPGSGAYWDTNPYGQIDKSYQVTWKSYETGCRELCEMICPEIETCPRTFYCRTPQGVILEAFEQLALGANALSMFVADTRSDEDWGYYRDTLFRRLAAAHSFLKGFHEANRGARPCGFSVPGGIPHTLVACRGIPIVTGDVEVLGELPDVKELPARLAGSSWQAGNASRETLAVQTTTGRAMMAFARRADASCGGRTPILFECPVRAWALPSVGEGRALRTVAIINASIDFQDPVDVRLRGMRGARISWVPLRGAPVVLGSRQTGREGEVIVTLPEIGAWDGGYLRID